MYLSPVGRQRIALILFIVGLAGCAGTPSNPPVADGGGAYPSLPPAGSGRGGYYMDDGPGDVTPAGLHNVPDARPKVEPYSRSGNKPYVVLGKRYVPITDDRPLVQEGYGSWYGKKFQGQKTSSGELYDMYKMTAAHPTLPLPSYARVTNLSNGKQVIVRVNDRGPFLSSRIIDLSYTAALKLGYIGQGSARLKVERLLPSDIEQINAATEQPEQQSMPQQSAIASSDMARPTSPEAASTPLPAAGYYLQFGAYAEMNNAEAARTKLSQDMGSALPPLTVESSNSLYRLFSGPFSSREEAMTAALRAQQVGANKPVIVQR